MIQRLYDSVCAVSLVGKTSKPELPLIP